MYSILLIDEDVNYSSVMAELLKDKGYSVHVTSNPIDGLDNFDDHKYDLVISEAMMKEMTGLRFVSFIKKRDILVKTILLTSFPAAENELEALTIGVDRYLTKELRLDVIIKYIDIILASIGNKQKKDNDRLIAHRDNVVLHLSSRLLYKNNEIIKITTKEYSIIKILLENIGQAVSREVIILNTWDTNHELVQERVVDTYVKAIRKKLKISSILAIRGYGYKWEE